MYTLRRTKKAIESALCAESLGDVMSMYASGLMQLVPTLFNFGITAAKTPRRDVALSSLLIKADEIIHQRPVRNRKLWINRKRQERNEIRRWMTTMQNRPF